MSKMLNLALDYAGSNIAVFPCREKDIEGDDGHGGTKVYKEKTPIPSGGLKAATTVERVIRNRWKLDPNSIVGAATGAISGFWVLDIDVPSDAHDADGRDWLDEMEAKNGRLPDTRISITANGGRHMFFNHVDGIKNSGGDIAPGIDVRGDGGFVVMPGSVMADGRFYEWENDEHEITDAPQWLLDLVLKKQVNEVHRQPVEYRESDAEHPAAAAALDGEVYKVSSMGQGGRGSAVNSAAFSLGTLVGGGYLQRSHCEDGLFNACISNGLVAVDGEREVLSKIRRGLAAGIRRPRTLPEVNQRPESRNTSLRDFKQMLERVKVREDAAAEYVDDVNREDDGSQYEEDYQSEQGEYDNPGEQIEEELKRLTATRYIGQDPARMPPRQWVWGRHLIRKFVSCTVAPGGVGKTALSVAEGLSMATAIDFLGVEVKVPLRVWLFNAEDPAEEMHKRLEAAKLYYDVSDDEIDGRIFIDSGRDQDLVIAYEDKKSGFKINTPIVEDVIYEILKHKIDVMIVDPFVSTHMVNENDNGAIDAVAKKWAQIADATNCAIDIVHHMKKTGDKEVTVEDVRGAGSLIGAARSVRLLSHLSPVMAEEIGVPEEDRPFIMCMSDGKGNFSPKLDGSTLWLRASQGLGNGRVNPEHGYDEEEDFMPVIRIYEKPKFMDGAVKLSPEQVEQLEGAFGAYSGVPMTDKKKDAPSAMRLLSFVLGIPEGEDIKTVKATMTSLLSSGRLAERTEQDLLNKRATKLVHFVK